MHFIADGFVDGVLVFEKGKTYEVDEKSGSASRWIRRGVAEPAQDLVLESQETKEETKEEMPKDEAKSVKGKAKVNGKKGTETDAL